MCGKSYTQGLSNETIVDRFPPMFFCIEIFASRFLQDPRSYQLSWALCIVEEDLLLGLPLEAGGPRLPEEEDLLPGEEDHLLPQI